MMTRICSLRSSLEFLCLRRSGIYLSQRCVPLWTASILGIAPISFPAPPRALDSPSLSLSLLPLSLFTSTLSHHLLSQFLPVFSCCFVRTFLHLCFKSPIISLTHNPSLRQLFGTSEWLVNVIVWEFTACVLVILWSHSWKILTSLSFVFCPSYFEVRYLCAHHCQTSC